MDFVTRMPRFPQPGETLIGHNFQTAPGGKGANQAVACARLGIPTALIGRVGRDAFGQTLRDSLQDYGVDCIDVAADPVEASGVAMIDVDDHAENTIVIVPGANGTVGAAELERLQTRLEQGAALVLLQLEIPLDVVCAAAQLARRYGATVLLDPAPARPLPDVLMQAVDVITPNATEAAALVGFPIRDQGDAARAAHILIERGVRRVALKMGSTGVLWMEHSTSGTNPTGFYPIFKVDTIDTVAAGDAFNGGMAVALHDGQPFADAVRVGAAVGALSTTKPGAQASMPDREAVAVLLATQIQGDRLAH